jgi:hypothetical protein
MLEAINVRFFGLDPEDAGDIVEISHDEFVELYAANPSAVIDIERHSVFDNGVRQLCITINQETNNA